MKRYLIEISSFYEYGKYLLACNGKAFYVGMCFLSEDSIHSANLRKSLPFTKNPRGKCTYHSRMIHGKQKEQKQGPEA
jgi:hypothetical protein